MEVNQQATRWGYFGLVLFFGLLYLLSATRHYAFDSVSYALQIRRFEESGEWRWLFHPHHLLFNVLGFVAHRLLGQVGIGVDPLKALQVLNAFLGAGGVAWFAWVAGALTGDSTVGLLCAAGLGLSYGYWTCATDGRANMPGTVVLIGMLGVTATLLDARRVRRRQRFVRRAALLGALHSLAVLLHQSHLLFLPAGVAAILLAPTRFRRRGLAAYLGVGGGITGLAYLFGARLATGGHDGKATLGWGFTYARQGWWWDFHIATNLVRDAQAFAHALLADPALAGTPGVGWVRLSAQCALAVGVVVAGMRLWQTSTHPRPATPFSVWDWRFEPRSPWLPSLQQRTRQAWQRRLLAVLGLWVCSYALFFTVWNPGYFAFWVPLLVPFWAFMAMGLASLAPSVSSQRAGIWETLLGLLFLAVSNALIGIGPHTHEESNARLEKARIVQAHVHAGDCMVVAGAGDDADAEVYVPYFAGCPVLSLNALLAGAPSKQEALLALQRGMDEIQAQGRKVYLHEELFSSKGPYATLEARYGITQAEVVRFLKCYYKVSAPIHWRGRNTVSSRTVVVRRVVGRRGR